MHKKKSPRIYTSMHSERFELTKLTYTRLEDNLIRHRGDRLTLYPSEAITYFEKIENANPVTKIKMTASVYVNKSKCNTRMA